MRKKKKSQKKGKSSKKNEKYKSSTVLVLSVKTGKGWQKIFKQKLTNKKPLSENEFDLYFDASDAVRNQIKDGVGKFKKGLKVKMEMVEESKSSKKKSDKKKGKKKKSSKSKSSSIKKIASKTASKNKSKSSSKVTSKSQTKTKSVSRVQKKKASKKGSPEGASLKKATRGIKESPKPSSKRKATRVAKTGATKKKASGKKSTITKKTSPTKRGRKPNPQKAGVDDLKKVMGIGAKMERILHSKGIKTYAALSAVGVRALQAIIDGAGGYYRSYKASMWKSEAALAKAGKFDKMKSGRR